MEITQKIGRYMAQLSHNLNAYQHRHSNHWFIRMICTLCIQSTDLLRSLVQVEAMKTKHYSQWYSRRNPSPTNCSFVTNANFNHDCISTIFHICFLSLPQMVNLCSPLKRVRWSSHVCSFLRSLYRMYRLIVEPGFIPVRVSDEFILFL